MQKSIKHWRVHSDELVWLTIPESGCQQQSLPDHIGDCHSRFFTLDSGLNYIETRYKPNCNVTVSNRVAQQESRMVLTVALSGHSQFQADRQDAIAFRGGFSTITTFNASEGERQYQADQSVTQLRFSMTQSWLAYYFGEGTFERFFARNALQLIRHQPCASNSILAGHSLLKTDLPLQAQSLFRQGQAMTIIASELGQLLNEHTSSIRFTAHDQRIAERARDILAADLKNPPGVEALSKQAGSNAFKLKQLFHHYYDTTPYGLLLDLRMQKAHQLLASGQSPVSVVAEAVGYRHASNFSAAFMKYFGFPPKQLTKSRC